MIYFFHGTDNYLSLKEASRTVKRLQATEPSLTITRVDAEDYPIERVITAYRTSDMFNPRKILFLKRISNNSQVEDLVDDLTDYAESISSSPEQNDNDVIVIWEASKIRINSKYYKFAKKYSIVYESPQLNKRTFLTWAKSAAEEYGLRPMGSTIQTLSHHSDYKTERFENELKKFKAAGIEQLTEETVQKLSTDSFENDIWNLLDNLNGPSGKKIALKTLQNLLSHNVDPYYIFAMVTRNLRILVQIKDLLDQNEERNAIASKLKLPIFTVPTLTNKASSLDKKLLCTLYEKCNNLDYEMKTGGINPELGLTMLISVL